MRYLLHESDHPISTDYYYECRKTTNDHFPIIPAHTHDYYEIYIYLSGSVMLFIEGRIYKVKRGDIMVIPPYTIHQLLLTSEEQLMMNMTAPICILPLPAYPPSGLMNTLY